MLVRSTPVQRARQDSNRGQLIDKSRRLSILARRQKEIPNIPTFSSRSAPIAYQLFDPEALYGCTHRLQAFPSTIFFFFFFLHSNGHCFSDSTRRPVSLGDPRQRAFPHHRLLEAATKQRQGYTQDYRHWA